MKNIRRLIIGAMLSGLTISMMHCMKRSANEIQPCTTDSGNAEMPPPAPRRQKFALLLATKNGDEELVKDILKTANDPINAGAEINMPDINGMTPLHWATWIGHKGIVEKLLNAGAELDLGCINGMMPLHFAACYGHKEIALMLLMFAKRKENTYGGKLALYLTMINDGFGRTPLDLARTYGHEEIVELFKQLKPIKK